jgi:hypothetical protein
MDKDGKETVLTKEDLEAIKMLQAELTEIDQENKKVSI